jgi:hypothetical protein
MASYTNESSQLLQKLAIIDLTQLQTLHIRAGRLHTWLFGKRDAHLARLVGDTSFLADLGKATVHLLQQVSCSTQTTRNYNAFARTRQVVTVAGAPAAAAAAAAASALDDVEQHFLTR